MFVVWKRLSEVVPILAIGLLVASGCARTVPQEVTDVNRALATAKDDCAGVYAASDLGSVQTGVDSMNGLADNKKYGKARKAAEPLLPRIQQLSTRADAARAEAKQAAQADLSAAEAAVDGARQAEAGSLVSTKFSAAEAQLAEARSLFSDPCKYGEASAAAKQASRLAEDARQAALAEKKRLEEDARRRAEEEARRRAEEEARRAAEERLKRFPPNYTVVKGDSLWKISGMGTIYDKSIYWPIVYDSNDDQIRDPDLIYPGQQLQIPRGMTPEAMDAKLHELWRRLARAGGE